MKAIVGTIVIVTLIVSFYCLLSCDSKNINSLMVALSVMIGAIIGLSMVGAFLYNYNKPVPDAFPKFAFITVLFIIPAGFWASALRLVISSELNLSTVMTIVLFLLIALETCLRGFHIVRGYAIRNSIIIKEAIRVLVAGFMTVAMPISVLAIRL